MLSWPGAEPSKESRMVTSSSYGVRGRSISQSPGGNGVQQQQRQYKVTWHVKPTQNDGRADSPVAEAGHKRGQVSAEHNQFQGMRMRRRHTAKISPARAG
ncbi:hypothetical protein TcCL_NonESM11489 [Trypanosoma cruzi]|nr:hypothetical protein TcCL_NonESM11489 [Trypanosoma cruzi]